MTALRKVYETVAANTTTTPSASLFDGDGIFLFSSGSTRSCSADAMQGDLTQMYSSGSARSQVVKPWSVKGLRCFLPALPPERPLR